MSNTGAVKKDLTSRLDEIRDDIEELFRLNLKITDWNVPEADDQRASEILIAIFQEKIDEIEKDVKDGKYENY